MTDLEVLSAAMKKFKKAKKIEDYDDDVAYCIVCQEICGVKKPDHFILADIHGCEQCVRRFGGLFRFKETECSFPCMGATIAGISLGEALHNDKEWKIFRKAYLKYLKAKRTELEK